MAAKLLMLLQSVFFVGKYIIQCPCLAAFHGFLPNLTFFKGTYRTTKGHASVGMNKQLNAIAHF
jgi:hypothetical protein